MQWALQGTFETKPEENDVRSEEARSINPSLPDSKDQENNKRAYNIRAKTKPQKYRYSLEEEYDYGEKAVPRADVPRRGRPAIKRDPDHDRRPEQVNPYEKAHYKKRKTNPILEGNHEQAVKEESPLRHDISEEKAEDHELHKHAQEEYGGEMEHSKKDEHLEKKEEEKGDAHDYDRKHQDKPFSELVEAYRRGWRTAMQVYMEIDQE